MGFVPISDDSAAQRLAARSDSSPELQNRLNTLKGMLEVAALQA